jgi:hypothetical protein
MEISKPLIFLSAADERVAPLTSKNRQRDNALTITGEGATRSIMRHREISTGAA